MKAMILAVPLLLTAFAAQAADMKALETRIETKVVDMKGPSLQSKIDTINQQWLAAFAKGDAAAIAALYTEDATMLPPGSDLVTGHAGITGVVQGMIKSGLKITMLKTLAIEQHGPSAREIGRFAGDVPGTDNKPVTVEGKYVVNWKDVKGQWKLDTDIWNMNK